MSFLKSRSPTLCCPRAHNAPYTIPITPMKAIHHWKWKKASGKIGQQMRSIPYTPIFNRTPARMTEIGVGASTCASGSHVWKGKVGTLIANPTKSPTNARYRQVVFKPAKIESSRNNSILVSSIRLNVPVLRYSPIITKRMNTEPKKV